MFEILCNCLCASMEDQAPRMMTFTVTSSLSEQELAEDESLLWDVCSDKAHNKGYILEEIWEWYEV